MLKAIIFDWDGTLADSVYPIVICKQFLAEKYYLVPPTEKQVRAVLGLPFTVALAQSFPEASPSLLVRIGKEFHNLMQQDRSQAVLFPGANAVLQVLKERGIKLAIATAKGKEEMVKAISYHGLEELFDLVCCGEEYKDKPHPAMLHYIMEKLAAKPDECLMVGDTITDMQFAANAGVKTVCVTFGAHSKTQLQAMNPAGWIDEWKQFIEVMDKLCYGINISSSSF